MQPRERVLVSILPFLAAGALAYVQLLPAMDEDRVQSEQLNDDKAQLEQLRNKLKQRASVQSQKQSLETDIDSLRGSVPKSPELDLLMLDLEKMCAAAGVGLVGVEPPSSDVMRQLDLSKDELDEVAAEAEQGKLTLGSKSLSGGGTTGSSTAGAAKSSSPFAGKGGQATNQAKTDQNKVGGSDKGILKKTIAQVFVTGSYSGLVDLIGKLESYERIIGIKHITVAVPTRVLTVDQNVASQKAQRLKLRQPLMAFVMTVYYLP